MKYINLWSDRPYSPFLMLLVVRATVFGLSKLFPSSIKEGGVYWENGVISYFYPESQLLKTVNDLSKKSLKSPNFFQNFLAIGLRKAKALKKFTLNYPKSKLAKLSNKKLISYIKEVSQKFEDLYGSATIAPLIGYQDDNPIYNKMNSILKSKLKNNNEKFAEYLVVLTESPKRLKTHNLELEILKIAKAAKKRGLKSKKEIIGNYRSKLEKIENDYKSLSFDFCNKADWDLNYLSKSVADSLKKDINQKINKIENYEEDVSLNFKKVCQKLKLNKKEKKIFELIRTLSYYKWAREFEFQAAIYNLKLAQDELARRSNLSTLESKYIFADELEKLSEKPKELKKMAQERYKNFLIIIKKDRSQKFYVGEEAKIKFKRLEFSKKEPNKNVREIKGTPAQLGIVRGTVKIINIVKDLKKIKKGDILVSVATNPDLMPGIKKAAAIVSDEGGVTCHAAIVSRELGIPCVIGTKIATKVLKDGDKVEVDATKGIVKKI